MKKYKKGERIELLIDFLMQERIMWHDKVYHKEFFCSWQMRFILSELKKGQFFKVIPVDLYVFVCYEENKHDIAIECGSISDLTVFNNAAMATEWFFKRLDVAKNSGFVIDSESELLKDGEISKKLVAEEIENREVSVTMFSGWQENWDESYDIVIQLKEVV